jgi:hypothetical protein
LFLGFDPLAEPLKIVALDLREEIPFSSHDETTSARLRREREYHHQAPLHKRTNLLDGPSPDVEHKIGTG